MVARVRKVRSEGSRLRVRRQKAPTSASASGWRMLPPQPPVSEDNAMRSASVPPCPSRQRRAPRTRRAIHPLTHHRTREYCTPGNVMAGTTLDSAAFSLSDASDAWVVLCATLNCNRKYQPTSSNRCGRLPLRLAEHRHIWRQREHVGDVGEERLAQPTTSEARLKLQTRIAGLRVPLGILAHKATCVDAMFDQAHARDGLR